MAGDGAPRSVDPAGAPRPNAKHNGGIYGPHRPEPLEAALERLSRALKQLEQAAEARSEADVRRAERDEALSVLQDDRSRLAVELDGALARNRSLEKAAEDVSR